MKLKSVKKTIYYRVWEKDKGQYTQVYDNVRIPVYIRGIQVLFAIQSGMR